jgi:hypothetical protein
LKSQGGIVNRAVGETHPFPFLLPIFEFIHFLLMLHL